MDDRRTLIMQTMETGNQAFQNGQLGQAIGAYEQAGALLTPAEGDMAPAVYENMALARMQAGRYAAAVRAFFRAVDGHWHHREQSLRFVIPCLLQMGKRDDAERLLRTYQLVFGPHPEPWVRQALTG